MIFPQEQTHPFSNYSTRSVLRLVKWNQMSFSSIEIRLKLDSSSEANSSCSHRSAAWSVSRVVSSPWIAILQIKTLGRSLMYSRKNCRTKNGALWNSSINWKFLWRLPIQNHLKLYFTEKRSKTKHLIWNSIRLEFVKKTSTPNSIKSLGHIKCYSLSGPRPGKNPSNFIILQLSEDLQLIEKT